jgi:hypothetical protein
MLTTPRAVLLGLVLIAAAVFFQPAMQHFVVPPAHAEWGQAELSTLNRIALALEKMRACRQ